MTHTHITECQHPESESCRGCEWSKDPARIDPGCMLRYDGISNPPPPQLTALQRTARQVLLHFRDMEPEERRRCLSSTIGVNLTRAQSEQLWAYFAAYLEEGLTPEERERRWRLYLQRLQAVRPRKRKGGQTP